MAERLRTVKALGARIRELRNAQGVSQKTLAGLAGAGQRYNALLFAMCGLSGLLYGIDMGLIAAALPYIRATCGFTESQLSSVVAAVLLGCIPGTMCAAWVAERTGRLTALKATALVDRRGRKFLLRIGTAGVALGLVSVGCLYLGLERGWFAAGPLSGWCIVAAFILFIGGFAIGPGVCVWLAMTELMPLRFRANGMMVAQFLAMGASYALAQTFLPWSKACGNSSVFLSLTVFAVLYFITVSFFLPETKGKSLEEIERMFAGKKG